jgi:hypothetical protein
MLHITNGSSVNLTGDVLVWADSLPDGPVPEGLALEQLSEVRAEFLARFFGLEHAQVRRDMQERDRRLQAWRDHDEVVLWFEHDLFDQLQLLQLLDYFSSQEGARGRVSLVQADTYLGQMHAGELAALFPVRRAVSAEQFNFGAVAWAAFRAPAPTKLAGIAARSELPYVAPAFRRHMEEFPSRENGLGRTQRQMLEVLDAHGPMTPRQMFLENQKKEDAVFLGDWSFFAHLRALASCSTPLLAIDGEMASVTNVGRDVLAGRADHIALNGIDHWLGGVHLKLPQGRGSDALPLDGIRVS